MRASQSLVSDRRGFLRQLAGFTAAAPAVAMPVIAAAAPVNEDPALLSLTRDLDRAGARARSTVERLAAAEAIYDARKAGVPADLVFDRWTPECRILEAKTETRYNGKLTNPTARGRFIVDAASLRELVAQADGRTRFGKRVRRMLKVAEPYEADLAALEQRLGLPDLTAEQSNAERDQHLVVERIVKTEARTMAGLALKARALLVMGGSGYSMVTGSWWGKTFAENVVAVEAARLAVDAPPDKRVAIHA